MNGATVRDLDITGQTGNQKLIMKLMNKLNPACKQLANPIKQVYIFRVFTGFCCNKGSHHSAEGSDYNDTVFL